MATTAAPTAAAVRRVRPTLSAAQQIREGKIGEGIKKIMYDRISLSGVNTLASVTYNIFNANTKAANPEKTNMLEPGKMGPNEAFVIQGVAIAANVNATAEGLKKFLQEARLRIGVGPDDVEKLSLPLIFLPSPSSVASAVDLTAKTPAGFYRLDGDQEINLVKGQPFSVRIIQGSAAPAMASGEVCDVFAQLFGTYQQQVVRG